MLLSLPPEILLQIAQHLAAPGLAGLVRSHTHLALLVTPLLYRRQVADDGGRAPLLHAAARGDLALLCELLDRYAVRVDEGADAADGRTALLAAAEHGQLRTMTFLVTRGADPNKVCQCHFDGRPWTEPNKTPAGENVALTTVTATATAGSANGGSSGTSNASSSATAATTSSSSPPGSSSPARAFAALHLAAANGHTHLIRYLLASGTPADQRVHFAHSLPSTPPLLLAAAGGHASTVALLLEHGANVEDEDYLSPPYHTDNPNAPPAARVNALVLALRGGHEAVVDVLLHAGATVNPARGFEPPLFVASHLDGDRRERCMQRLFACGADVTPTLDLLWEEGWRDAWEWTAEASEEDEEEYEEEEYEEEEVRYEYDDPAEEDGAEESVRAVQSRAAAAGSNCGGGGGSGSGGGTGGGGGGGGGGTGAWMGLVVERAVACAGT